MMEVMNMIKTYNIEILIGLVISILILLILNIISQVRIGKIRKKYDAVVRGTEDVNLEELLIDLRDNIEEMGVDTGNIKRDLKTTKKALSFAIQKVSLVRYDAFDDVGSSQSYSAALLDEYNNGLILTNIYSREYSASYAKPIDKGGSEYNLSKEEKEALEEAMGK